MPKETSPQIRLLDTYFRRQPADALCFADYEDGIAIERIAITNFGALTADETSAIHSKIHRYGFALVQMDPSSITKASIKILAEQLNVGAPFVPPYFEHFNSQIELHDGINTIGATSVSHDMTFPQIQHGAFGTKAEQGLHVDGTVQDIGQIQTSIIACHTRAVEGGLSTFFNSTAALRKLVESYPSIAKSMLAPDALSRAVDSAPTQLHTGPVFSLIGDKLHTRFSTDKRSYWDAGFTKVPHLKEAYDYFASQMYSGSPHYIKTLLEPGQAIIMANSKISHGRTAYESHPNAERKMFRALFEKSLI